MVEEPRPDEKGVQKDSLRRGQEAKWVTINASIVAITITLILLVILGSVFGIVGRSNAVIVGAVLTLVGVLITQMVNTFNARDAQKHQQKLEDQRAQDSALQAFLDQISHSDAYSELRTAPASGHKRAILRAKIQTLLLQLDEERKGVLLSFLHGAKLSRKKEITPYEYTKDISEWKGEERWRYPILRLDHIDFSRTKRTPDNKLTFDDLRGIILRGAKLNEVNLSGANLTNADLRDADLSCAQLRRANEDDSETIPGEWYNEYRKAIRGRSASGLQETDSILEIDLSEANLSGADLSGADLSGAIGVTAQQLDMCKSCAGAIMPNGQKYENWLKDKKVINCHRDWDFILDVKNLTYKEGRREDGENSGPS